MTLQYVRSGHNKMAFNFAHFDEHKIIYQLVRSQCWINPIPNGGGGGQAESTRPQIVFFVTSVRDVTEPQNLVTFSKL